MELQQFFRQHPAVALAFSGGTDSAFLLWAAKKYCSHVKAYYVKTPFQPQFEHEDACRLARQLDVPMQTIDLDILRIPCVAENGKDRCYHCKKAMFSAIAAAARQDGFATVIDGTNASDDPGDRPGMKALKELNILSPLRTCGMTKSDVRKASREADLFTHDKPAYACLATRVPTGTPITSHDLRRTEAAEEYLMKLGFSDFRIRLMGNSAKLEVRQEQQALAANYWPEILSELTKYYDAVLPDLEVRT